MLIHKKIIVIDPGVNDISGITCVSNRIQTRFGLESIMDMLCQLGHANLICGRVSYVRTKTRLPEMDIFCVRIILRMHFLKVTQIEMLCHESWFSGCFFIID